MLNILIPDFRVIAPELLLTATAMIIILWEMINRTRSHAVSANLALVGSVAALAATVASWNLNVSTFGDSLVLDPYASFFKVIFLAGLILSVSLSMKYIQESGVRYHAEYYALMVLATVGMMIMAMGRELITIFIGLELLSMPLYILAGFFRKEIRSNEAGFKYFVLGSFATGIMLFGMSYIYGVSGSTHLQVIARTLYRHPSAYADKALLLGLLLVIVGFGFKISVVPFHQWTPDVYEGAPTPVTAFMSAGPKAAGLAALIRILVEGLPRMAQEWELIVAILSVLTMTVGNLTALRQTNIKRMLAYSSIAHVGYILIAVVASVGGRADLGFSAVMFYLLSYTFMNIGAFGIIVFMKREGIANENLDDFTGLSWRSPGAAIAMLVFLFSLAGIPPTAGFAAKLSVFFAAIQGEYYWLAIIGILNSAVAAYYYLRIVVLMYMKEPEKELGKATSSPLLWTGISLALVGTLYFGILPGGFLEKARIAVSILLKV
ncbi:MAG: NADH-quinone oxidoreductase subunit N [Proteobacteria bacterium]|nr:NADH-quinone oxidoreductase subunit N [Pseudomonadota bacterium]